jgi:CRISPR-associated endonuclease/helicase Cas3
MRLRLVNMNSRFSQLYTQTCGLVGYKERKFIRQALERFEEQYAKDKKGVLILSAPTGYGKSLITYALYLGSLRADADWCRVIHVLPMTSIIQDFAENARRKLGGNLRAGDLAEQHHGAPGSPYFAKRFIVTTLDTFTLNLFKLPAVEVTKQLRYNTSHFELPRAMIYSSAVVFDEFHLFAPTESGESRMLTVAVSAIKALAEAGTPTIIITATMDNQLAELLKQKISPVASVVYAQYIPGEDQEWERANRREISVIGQTQTPEKTALELAAQNKSVLIVANTVHTAIQLFQSLRTNSTAPDNLLLLHAKLNRNDRNTVMEKLKQIKEDGNKIKGGNIVVSTQLVEAGVDVSFDALITEAAPAQNIVQRAGRVARMGGQGELYYFAPKNSEDAYEEGIYDPQQTAACINTLEKLKDNYFEPQKLLGVQSSTYSVDPLLERILAEIEANPVFTSEDTARVYQTLCGILRESNIVMAYSESDFTAKSEVPLNDQQARRVISQTLRYLDGEGRMRDFTGNPWGDCLSLKLQHIGAKGVIYPEKWYTPQIGLVIPKVGTQ